MKRFLIALTFLTRIPLPFNTAFDQEDFRKAQPFYPLVGLIIGLGLLLLWKITSLIFPPLIVAAFLIAGEIFLTGGIHLDGFMDSMDGLLSGRNREKTLEIMKDSRIGSYAAVHLLTLLILKFAFFATLDPQVMPFILILYPALSRWALLAAILYFPYIRSEGLGKGLHENATHLFFIIEGLVLVIAAFFLLHWTGPLLCLSALLTSWLMGQRVTKILGGLTGDIYGAIIEICQLIILIFAYIGHRIF